MKESVAVLAIGAALSGSQVATSSSAAMKADIDALVRTAPLVTETWIRQTPPPVREVTAVVRHGRGVAPLLLALLPDADIHDTSRWRVQQQVTLALSAIYEQSPHCGRVYCDGDNPQRHARIKQSWVRTVTDDQELRALPASELVARFKREPIFWRQFEVAQALAASGDRAAIGALEEFLKVDDRHVRGNAAFVLGRLGDPRGFATIAEIVDDRSPRSAGQGIASGRWTLDAQIRADRYYAAHLLGDLQDSRGVDVLIPLLADRDAGSVVPWALARIGDRRAIEPLVNALERDDPSSRVLAIGALESLDAREALPVLQTLLQDTRRSNFGELMTVADAARRAVAVISGNAARLR
jgi:HEAT repeat protein